jgi:hypothetical protein
VQLVNELQGQVGAQEPPLPAPTGRSEGIAYGGDRVLPAVAGIPSIIGDRFNKFSEESQASATKRREAIANLFDPTKNSRRTTTVVEPKPAAPKVGLPAAAAAVDQSKLKGAPQPAPEGKTAEGKTADDRSGASSKGLGFTKIPMPDGLGYTAKTPEEIETQIAAMSGRGMEKNKGILDAEAADVKEESDALLKAKGGDQKRLLFSMAAAAFGSKAQGLDLGGIMTAGLKTDADQRKLNTESEKALRESKKQMRRYEQALKDGSDVKAGQLYGLAAAEAKVAQDAKEKQIDLALKQQGLDLQKQSLKVQQSQAGRNQQLELLQAAMRDPKLMEAYLKMHPSPDRSAANDLKFAEDLSKIRSTLAESQAGLLLMRTDPVAFEAAVIKQQAEYAKNANRPEVAALLGFGGGAGTGSRGPIPIPGGDK